VLLHVLGHVERDQRLLVTEQELGERLGELGLADAGGAEEDERAARTRGSFRPARVRRIDWDTADTALSWPMIRLCSSPSMLMSFWVSSSVSL
jgi:hypothetical protein